MTARILKVTPTEYHKDLDGPSLSSSMAHTLVAKSPAHAWTDHPRFGGARADASDAMNEGSLIHKLVLGEGAEIAVIDADAYRSTAAKQAKEAAIAEGKIPVLAPKFEPIKVAAANILENIHSFGIELDGQSEIAIEFEEVGQKGPVLCRSMLDNVNLELGLIRDVKKIRSADPRTIERHAYSYGYDIQYAAYTSAVEKLKPELEGRSEFMFIFCEIEPPYAVVPARPSGALKALGESRWLRAVQLWEECLRTDKWPAYCTSPITLEPPGWAISVEEGNFE